MNAKQVQRISGKVAASATLIFVFTALGAQESEQKKASPESIVGAWALFPLETDAPAPPPPPAFASYRTKPDPPLETIARVILSLEEGRLSGVAVFPEGIVLTDDNRDVSGRSEIKLLELKFDGLELSFAAEVEEVRFEGRAELERDRFLGVWKAGDREGSLYLVRRQPGYSKKK